MLVALVIGFFIWRQCGSLEWYSSVQWVMVVMQGGIATLPPINRWLRRSLDSMRIPSPRTRRRITAAITVIGSVLLYLIAVQQGRDFFPKFHDESMHLIQARMLAQGRLWLPSHALPQFFETFHVFTKPVYAPMQFPGASLLHVPGLWLGFPYWVTPLVIGGMTVGLLYRVMAEIIDAVAGLIASVLLIGVLQFRFLSLMVLSNPAALLLGLLVLWAWLRWKTLKTPSSACLIGFFSGWAAITRPPDALCFCIPVGFAMMWALKKEALIKWGFTASALLIGALPFLGLQLIFNHGVTGRWLQSPHERYVQEFHPGCTYGLSHDLNQARPQTTLQQKIDYYDSFMAPDVGRYTRNSALRIWINERFPLLFKATLPSLLLISLLLAGLLKTARGYRWVPLGVLPLFIGFYALSTHFDPQYCIIASVAVLPLSILGARCITDLFGRWKPYATPVAAVMLCGVSLGRLPQLNPGVTEQYPSPGLEAVERKVGQIRGRAVVFFHYQPGVNVHEEPVYNIEFADIDAARIVRAQDLGAGENLKLIRYYAARQPDREAYLFNRADRTLTHLGPVATLAADSH